MLGIATATLPPRPAIVVLPFEVRGAGAAKAVDTEARLVRSARRLLPKARIRRGGDKDTKARRALATEVRACRGRAECIARLAVAQGADVLVSGQVRRDSLTLQFVRPSAPGKAATHRIVEPPGRKKWAMRAAHGARALRAFVWAQSRSGAKPKKLARSRPPPRRRRPGASKRPSAIAGGAAVPKIPSAAAEGAAAGTLTGVGAAMALGPSDADENADENDGGDQANTPNAETNAAPAAAGRAPLATSEPDPFAEVDAPSASEGLLVFSPGSLRGVRVFIDGALADVRPERPVWRGAPGPHFLSALHRDGRRFARDFVLESGEEQTMTLAFVSLDPTDTPDPETPAAKAPSTGRWWVWASIGTAVVAGTATAIALSAGRRSGPAVPLGTGTLSGTY